MKSAREYIKSKISLVSEAESLNVASIHEAYILGMIKMANIAGLITDQEASAITDMADQAWSKKKTEKYVDTVPDED